ncbi:MAG: cbb3-type cytochrome oxidase subunit 3 [Pseudomonadales bacterium]
MSATLFSLISVVVGFTALVVWVYWPSRKGRLEALGRIPLEDTDDNTEERIHE